MQVGFMKYFYWLLLLICTFFGPGSLQPLFKYVESGSEIREKVICFLKDKVFPVKAELLKPQAEMERYITDLIKKVCLHYFSFWLSDFFFSDLSFHVHCVMTFDNGCYNSECARCNRVGI
jgi:hypothetical protein